MFLRKLNIFAYQVGRNKWWVLMILLVVGAIGFGLYRDYSVKADKEKFEQAKASIDALYADIVTKVGQPAKTERSQTCGYAVRKYEKGPLSCGDYLYFVYRAEAKDEASRIAEEIINLLAMDNDFHVTYSNAVSNLPFTDLLDNRASQEVGFDLEENKTNMSCPGRIVYATPNNTKHFLSVNGSPFNMSVGLVCQMEAKKEYYPLKAN